MFPEHYPWDDKGIRCCTCPLTDYQHNCLEKNGTVRSMDCNALAFWILEPSCNRNMLEFHSKGSQRADNNQMKEKQEWLENHKLIHDKKRRQSSRSIPISIRGEAVGSYNWASGSHKGVGSTSTIWLQPRYIGPFGSHLQPYLRSSCGWKTTPMFGTYINKVSKSCTS